MRTLTAAFYDGKTSERKEVQLQLDEAGRLFIRGLEDELVYPLADVKVAPRVGNTPRSIYLPGGAKCETLDNDAIDAFLQRRGRADWSSWLHRLESRLGYVLVALVLTVVTVWGLIQYGVPALAKHVAHALPSSVDAALGQESLEIMDQTLFSPSQLSEQRQRELRTAFAKMTQNVLDGHDWQFELRSSKPVGPNAFALPSGIVVLTDELVLLAKEDQEIVAVLAHEMGHVVHRHALRRLLQDSVVVLLIAAVTGDVTAITSLAATIPVVLVEAKYSRDFEREADHFALQYLRQHDIAPKHFAAILLRMEKESPDGDAMHDYLSTHPATRERVKIFQEEG